MGIVDPSKVVFFCPPGLSKFKLSLFERIGRDIKRQGGKVVVNDQKQLDDYPDDIVPIVGCTPSLRPQIDAWTAKGRTWVYWDRGYARRIFATWLPRGNQGGFYRWHVNSFQLQTVRPVPDDRWNALKTEVKPWAKGGKHIVIAAPTFPYSAFHHSERWTDETIDALSRATDRPLMVRFKSSTRPLAEDLKGAHALVAHGSNAAVEAVIMGCPVFVDKSSAAALVGKSDVSDIEKPIYPERQPWLNALAYSSFNEEELCNGVLWRLLT